MNLLILESLVDLKPEGGARVKGPKGLVPKGKAKLCVPLMRIATLKAPIFLTLIIRLLIWIRGKIMGTGDGPGGATIYLDYIETTRIRKK